MPKNQDEVVPQPFAQWLLWEEQSNFSGFRTTTESVELEVVAVPRAELCVEIVALARQSSERGGEPLTCEATAVGGRA